jgi:uncharacterized membrane protein (DUF485 family)
VKLAATNKQDGPETSIKTAAVERPGEKLVRHHLRFGWLMLLAFLTLGIVLEGLHAFKVAEYLNPSYATRRLMWTLAHAHGTLLGLLNLAFAFTLGYVRATYWGRAQWASILLRGATIFLPLGFFLGGIHFVGGDPGLGIALVPLGALLLLVSAIFVLTALG